MRVEDPIQCSMPAWKRRRTKVRVVKAFDSNFTADVWASEAETAKDAGMIGYMARQLLQATLPHSAKSGNEFTRTNGNLRVTILAPASVGLPYGSYPRLLLIWMTTEATLEREKTLYLGESLSKFMTTLGLLPTGGEWGTIPRFYDQSGRLFQSHVSVCESTNTDIERGTDGRNMTITNNWSLRWNLEQAGGKRSLVRSWVNLSDSFFQLVIDRPVPIDLRVIRKLKKSPMALDLYMWSTYRMSYLRRRTEIPWGSLRMQFGADYADTPEGYRNFRKKFGAALRKVSDHYSELRVAEGRHGLVLLPSPPHVPRLG